MFGIQGSNSRNLSRQGQWVRRGEVIQPGLPSGFRNGGREAEGSENIASLWETKLANQEALTQPRHYDALSYCLVLKCSLFREDRSVDRAETRVRVGSDHRLFNTRT